MKLLLVAGARPNFMKIAPLARAFDEAGFQRFLVHTGQHYDEAMSRVFFTELGIPKPDVDLGVGSGSHARQTAEVMIGIEPVIAAQRPDVVVVVGDVNSTLAAALTAVKLGVPVAHVEAGLRSFDETMPEEINRRLVDAISALLFVSEPSGMTNLAREGTPADRVHFVGNVMIDTLLAHRDRARERRTAESLGVEPGRYAVLTLHRPSNVDDPAALAGILDAVAGIAEEMPVLFPIHPRTRKAVEAAGLSERVAAAGGLRLLAPLGYLDFLSLISDSMLVLTDSGGIQEETTVLSIPCLTLRSNTERPVTVAEGTNRLVGADPKAILAAYRGVREGEGTKGRRPALWDGGAARRIAAVLAAFEGRNPWRGT